MKQFGPRFVGPKEAIAGTLALLALSPLAAGMIAGIGDPIQQTAAPAVAAAEPAEEEGCPETVVSDYYTPWRAALKEYRETHDAATTLRPDWPEYVALKGAMFDGAEEYFNAQGCETVSGIVVR